jgi:hypothetical protein
MTRVSPNEMEHYFLQTGYSRIFRVLRDQTLAIPAGRETMMYQL